jgi:hypothetical protein
VRKGFELGVGICAAVKDEISGLQVLLLQSLVRKQVELVGLVPLAQRVAEVLPEVEDALSNQSATVNEQGSGVEWVSRLMEFLTIGNSDVLVCGLDELLPELEFKIGRGSIDLYVFEVFVEFELIELFLLELFEGILDGGLGREVLEELVFLASGGFHVTVIGR